MTDNYSFHQPEIFPESAQPEEVTQLLSGVATLLESAPKSDRLKGVRVVEQLSRDGFPEWMWVNDKNGSKLTIRVDEDCIPSHVIRQGAAAYDKDAAGGHTEKQQIINLNDLRSGRFPIVEYKTVRVNAPDLDMLFISELDQATVRGFNEDIGDLMDAIISSKRRGLGAWLGRLTGREQ
jgi:hypothetical protein